MNHWQVREEGMLIENVPAGMSFVVLSPNTMWVNPELTKAVADLLGQREEEIFMLHNAVEALRKDKKAAEEKFEILFTAVVDLFNSQGAGMDWSDKMAAEKQLLNIVTAENLFRKVRGENNEQFGTDR